MTRSDDERALLEAIHGAPEDDGPRLAFADWLEEHAATDADRARAEFIRLQIELAGYGQFDPKARRLREREKALLEKHSAEWSAPFAPADEVQFHRGFAYSLSVSVPDLAARPELLAAGPFIVLWPHSQGPIARPTLRTLAGNPLLARVPQLQINSWDLAELRALLRSPHLAGLTGLHLNDGCCRPPYARLLAECEHLTALRHVGFYGDYEGRLGRRGVEWLAGAPHLASLRSLNLQNNRLKDDALESLAASPYLKNLEDLALGWGSYTANQIGPAGARAIAGSPHFARLKSLDLGFSFVGNEGVEAMAKSPHLAAMGSLNVPVSGAGDGAFAALAQNAGMPRLSFLNVSSGGLTDDGLTALARSARLATFTEIKPASTHVGDAGARALADSPHAANLRRLNLRECRLTKAGIEALLDSPHLAGLEELSVSKEGLPKALQQRLKERFGE